MFIDSVDIFVHSGSGGSGAVSFRREKFIAQGGPDGGDGGRGGDIIFKVDSNANTLSRFRGVKHHKAQNGQGGKGRLCRGKNGENLIIYVPLGTQIYRYEDMELLADLDSTNASITLLKGGKGGLGNAHFKSSRNQAPTHAQQGIAGQSLHILLELKLIADVGLVGYPNAGKSSLISCISNAKPEVANYEFTTLTPHLGVVNVDELHSFVVADIPGIIDGASEGKGLGLNFLKHIERTAFLLFVLDGARDISPKMQYENLRSELSRFKQNLNARGFGIVLSKADVCENPKQNLATLKEMFGGMAAIDMDLDSSRSLDSSLNAYKCVESALDSSKKSNGVAESNKEKKAEITKPAFIIEISSITQKNIKELGFLMFKALKGA